MLRLLRRGVTFSCCFAGVLQLIGRDAVYFCCPDVSRHINVCNFLTASRTSSLKMIPLDGVVVGCETAVTRSLKIMPTFVSVNAILHCEMNSTVLEIQVARVIFMRLL